VKTLSLCTPVWGRAILTEILFRERVRTFEQARELGVECQCVVIGEGSDLELARSFGFPTIEAPNVLGRKYNDGHEWAVREGFDFSFQVNSDQTFDPRLLAAIAESPTDSFIQTRWLTSIHRDGEKAIATWNPLWAMRAYPLELLRRAPRPCNETLDRMCDSGVYEGVLRANPDAPTHEVVLHPMETIQFESPTQLTSWGRHVKVGLMTGTAETRVPWEGITLQHGEAFTREIKDFYGVR
jgi:hypothetical protein